MRKPEDIKGSLSGQQLLDRAFEALRSECAEEPPLWLEASLRAQFRRRQMRQRSHRHLVQAGLGIAAACVIALLCIAATQRLRPQKPEQASAKIAKPAYVTTQSPSTAAAARTSANRLIARTAKPSRPAKQARLRPVQPVEASAGFISIPYTEPLNRWQQIDVYRVEMPRATIAQFGLPLTPNAINATVTADLMVGQDGVVRAIRFVR